MMKAEVNTDQKKSSLKAFLNAIYLPGEKMGKMNACLICILALDMLVIISIYYLRYEDALDALYRYTGSERKILIEGMVMTDFNDLTSHSFRFFLIYIAICVFDAVYNYRYFLNTRTIYVMNRMNKRLELHRRCLVHPIVALVIGIIVLGITYFIFMQVYLHCTPVSCLPEWQGTNIWRAF